MEAIARFYQQTIGSFIPKEFFVFFISMCPFIESKGGLVVASLLKIPFWWGNLICLAGNILIVPLALNCIQKVFDFMKSHHIFTKFILKLEARAERQSKNVRKGEIVSLFLFVAVPIPGTGGWAGALVASILGIDKKQAAIAISLGIFTANLAVNLLTYGTLSFFG